MGEGVLTCVSTSNSFMGTGGGPSDCPCCSRKDRFRPLPARGREARGARAGGKRRRDHRAHGVGETAAVSPGDPARERELMRSEKWDGVH